MYPQELAQAHQYADERSRQLLAESSWAPKWGRFKDAVKKVVIYNAYSPIEQPLIFFPIATVLGILARKARSGSIHHSSTIFSGNIGILVAYIIAIISIWMLQERLAIWSLSLNDPLVIRHSPEKTVASPDNLEHEEDDSEGLDGREEQVINSNRSRPDEFWSYKSYRHIRIPERLFSAEQEDAIRTVVYKYFSGNDVHLWNEAKYLCVNDDARWGAIRALDARSFHVNAACKVIEETIMWRRRENVNDIFRTRLIPAENVMKIRLALGDGFYGVDKTGHPIWWCPAGSVNLNHLKEQCPLEHLLWLHVMMMEFNQRVWFRSLSRSLNANVYQLTIVLDLTGFSVSSVRGAFNECLTLIGDVDKDYYYEDVYRVYIINAPIFFRFFWRTLSPLFDQNTRVKFQMLSRPSDLNHFIDSELIPRRFGGRSTTKDVLFGEDGNTETIYTRHMDDYVEGVRSGFIVDDNEYVSSILSPKHHHHLVQSRKSSSQGHRKSDGVAFEDTVTA